MANTDWNTNKDLNVTIDGVQIDDGLCESLALPFAVRTIMADLAFGASPAFAGFSVGVVSTTYLAEFYNATEPKLALSCDAGGKARIYFVENSAEKWRLGHNGTSNQFVLGDLQNSKTPVKVNLNTADNTLVLTSTGVGVVTDSPTEALDVNGDAIRIRTAQTPASASATGTQGQVCWDASYIYVCTATNTWKRAAIATW